MRMRIINKPPPHLAPRHLLQTKRLRANLQHIILRSPLFRAPLPPLILHRIQLPAAILNQIRLSNQPIAIAPQPNPPHLPNLIPSPAPHRMHPLVQPRPLQRELILHKPTRTKHPPAPMRAIGKLIQRRNRHIIPLIHPTLLAIPIPIVVFRPTPAYIAKSASAFSCRTCSALTFPNT